MIRVCKSTTPPAALAKGKALTRALQKAYDAEPDAYRSGRKRMTFDKSSYGSSPIKSALSRDQHGKCCYCESKFTHTYHGDVEHFRPKGAVSAASGRTVPGYYWLAYDWGNLLFSCAICNQTYKRDQFPVLEEAERVRHHHAPPDGEVPLLVNPLGPTDPREHIRFNLDVAVGRTEAGEETIRVTGLDRDSLALERRAHLRTIGSLCDALVVLQQISDVGDLATRIRGQLQDATSPQAVFSAATLDFISKRHL